jgi:hypothetical protein
MGQPDGCPFFLLLFSIKEAIMGSADYDLLLQEINQEIKRTGLDKGGYKFTLTQDEPVTVSEQNDEE